MSATGFWVHHETRTAFAQCLEDEIVQCIAVGTVP